MHPTDELMDEMTLEAQATRWFSRQRSGEMTADEARALQTWLDADARHRVMFEAVEAIWNGFGLTRDAPEVVSLRAAARQRTPDVRRPAALGRLAAGLAVAVALGAGVWGVSDIGRFAGRDFPNQTFSTDVGQRSTVKLPDGSTVTLNTATVMRTVTSDKQRLIYLDKGQAFFRVAKDRQHPFVVHAAGRTVTALGTAFDVRADPARFEVTLVEGKVKVETPLPGAAAGKGAGPAAVAVLAAPRQATELLPGTQFVAAAGDERWSVQRTNTINETAWVTGWLQFDRTPLRDAVDELSRYSSRQLVLDDPELGSMPISGRFKADDPEAFVQAVAVYGIAPVDSSNRAEIRLRQKRG